MAWERWRNAGSPRSGPLFNEKNASKREVTKFANKCRARMDRNQWLNHELKFKDRDNSRFRVQKTKSVMGTKLLLDGVPTTDPSKIMQSWLNHFRNLFKSEAHSITGISAIQDQIPLLTNQSMLNCDGVLDDPFSSEEIEHAVRRLKSGKASGIDGLVPENIKAAGPSLIVWLRQIFNASIEFEHIPQSLLTGIIRPISRGREEPYDL